MRIASTSELPLRDLISHLPREAKAFVKEELELAKKEISEKLSKSARNAITLVAGAVVAYAGLIVTFLGLGLLASWGFESLGWSPLAASAAGIGFVGLAIATTGTIVLLKGLKSLKKQSLVPEKTIETLSPAAASALSEHSREARKKVHEADSRTSDDLQAEALTSKSQMEQTIEEIGMRLRPSHVRRQMERALLARPERWAAVLAGGAMVGGFLLKRKSLRRKC